MEKLAVCFVEATEDLQEQVVAAHIPGEENRIADLLSRQEPQRALTEAKALFEDCAIVATKDAMWRIIDTVKEIVAGARASSEGTWRNR